MESEQDKLKRERGLNFFADLLPGFLGGDVVKAKKTRKQELEAAMEAVRIKRQE